MHDVRGFVASLVACVSKKRHGDFGAVTGGVSPTRQACGPRRSSARAAPVCAGAWRQRVALTARASSLHAREIVEVVATRAPALPAPPRALAASAQQRAPASLAP